MFLFPILWTKRISIYFYFKFTFWHVTLECVVMRWAHIAMVIFYHVSVFCSTQSVILRHFLHGSKTLEKHVIKPIWQMDQQNPNRRKKCISKFHIWYIKISAENPFSSASLPRKTSESNSEKGKTFVYSLYLNFFCSFFSSNHQPWHVIGYS